MYQEGYISISKLQTLLTELISPELEDDKTFKAVMNSCGLKATGKIDWQQFLSKFSTSGPNRVGGARGPQAPQAKGLAIPIRSNNRKNPIHSITRFNTEEEVLETLWNYLSTSFETCKVAYLYIDQNKKRILEPNEFEKFIKKKFPNLKINKSIIKKLLVKLDPEGSGKNLSYEKFRDMFEIKEQILAHKWLEDKHHVNEIIENRLPWPSTLEVIRTNLLRSLPD